MKPEAEPNPALKATPTSFSRVSVHQTEVRHRTWAFSLTTQKHGLKGGTETQGKAGQDLSKYKEPWVKPQQFSFPEAPVATQWHPLLPSISYLLSLQLHSRFHHPYRVHQGICDKGWRKQDQKYSWIQAMNCHEPYTLCSETLLPPAPARGIKNHTGAQLPISW